MLDELTELEPGETQQVTVTVSVDEPGNWMAVVGDTIDDYGHNTGCPTGVDNRHPAFAIAALLSNGFDGVGWANYPLSGHSAIILSAPPREEVTDE